MRYAKLVDYIETVKFCVSGDGWRRSGSWDVSTVAGREGLDGFVAALERCGYRVERYDAGPHQLLAEMRREAA